MIMCNKLDYYEKYKVKFAWLLMRGTKRKAVSVVFNFDGVILSVKKKITRIDIAF